MSLFSKRLVSTVASTVLLSLVSAAANAQGKWYTDYTTWHGLVTNVRTADYDQGRTDSSPWEENEVTATAASGTWEDDISGALNTYDNLVPVTFSFTGNAFGGFFGLTDYYFPAFTQSGMTFSIGGSNTNVYSLTSTTTGSCYTFLGYISDSPSDISVTVNGVEGDNTVTVDSFSFGNRKPLDPGSNVAPEPGSFALALTGGAALLGICVRRRRNAG